MLQKSIIVLLFVSIFPYILTAQSEREVKVCGEYTYVQPADVSLNDAKQIALDRAKINAIAEEFGTIISSVSTTVITNENNSQETSSKSGFYSLGSSDVKGEWIEDLGEPRYSFAFDEKTGERVITVEVCGKAREINTAPIDIEYSILRNGLTDRHKAESNIFYDGDDFYLKFETPVSGYLTVYLVDSEQNVYCLLPYQYDSDGQYYVENNREYILFSEDRKNKNEVIDEYQMFSSSDMESNFIYIIFSPNSFTKAKDDKKQDNSEYELPRTLSFKEFSKWLANNRKRDHKMQLIKDVITIRKE